MNLKIINLSVKINDKIILDNINLEFVSGIYVIKGPNGSGKTTLLKTIAGFYKPLKGKIIFNGKDITDLSINERVKEGIMYIHQIPPRDVEVRLKDLLRVLENKGFVKRKVNIIDKFINRKMYEEFSGGEAKLVDFLLSYIQDPKVYLIDEIDSGLDEKNIEFVGNLLKKEKNKIIILTTHTDKIVNYLSKYKILYIRNGKVFNP